MKFVLLLTSAILAATAVAEEDPTRPRLRPTAPIPVAPEPVEAPAPPPVAPVTNESLGLIPEVQEPVKKPKMEAQKDPTEKIDRTTAAENDMASRVRLRELTTRVRQEPKVAAEWERAKLAKTDYTKREALKSYYQLLYDRIVKIDPSLRERVAVVRSKSLHRLSESRIDPTEPIDPSERGNRTN